MNVRIVALAVYVTGLVSVVPSRAQDMPPLPKPGPAHDVLKMEAGTWDATVEVTAGPGAPPMTSKGVEINTIGCGGLCLISDFKGEFMPGVPFAGHGVVTWDSAKKKYVGSWTDSISQGLALAETTWDPVTKKMTGWMEGRDMTGTLVKTRSVTELGEGTRVFTAYGTGPDGKETQVLRVTYARRK